MIFKLFKIHRSLFKPKVTIELLWNVSDEKYSDRLTRLLDVFGLLDTRLVCSCTNYEKSGLLNIDGEDVEMNVVEKKAIWRNKIYKQLEIVFNPSMLGELLRIADDDTSLHIVPVREVGSKTELVFNDNGNDFVVFDKDEHDVDNVEIKLKNIV